MRRWLRPLAVLILAQGILLLAYFGWQRTRPEKESQGRFEAERVDLRHAPAMTFQRRDGSPVDLAAWKGRPVFVHFWATWCTPCARELPQLLDAARRAELPLLAVSLDHDFKLVDTFFGGEVPEEVVLGDAASAKAALGVGTLPDSSLLDAQGSPTFRVQGERDWTTRSAREWLEAQGR